MSKLSKPMEEALVKIAASMMLTSGTKSLAIRDVAEAMVETCAYQVGYASHFTEVTDTDADLILATVLFTDAGGVFQGPPATVAPKHAHDMVEVALTDECEFGCKILACECGERVVSHRRIYGCTSIAAL